MKVRDLIALLSSQDKEADVMFNAEHEGLLFSVEEIGYFHNEKENMVVFYGEEQ